MLCEIFSSLQAGWEKNLDIMCMGHVRGIFLALEKMGTSHGSYLFIFISCLFTNNSSLFTGGKGGRIINVASSAGLIDVGFGPITNCGYRVSKHAMVSMTRGLSKSTLSFEKFQFADPVLESRK